jgi:hypothetical protein
MIVAVKIRNWGYINCSSSNVHITENAEGELFRRIKTNAIDLTIPYDECEVKEL